MGNHACSPPTQPGSHHPAAGGLQIPCWIMQDWAGTGKGHETHPQHSAGSLSLQTAPGHVPAARSAQGPGWLSGFASSSAISPPGGFHTDEGSCFKDVRSAKT